MNTKAAALGTGWEAASHTPDDRIVALCLDGANENFELLVRRYGDLVYRTIYLMTRDAALTEDLTQETFVDAWRGLPGFRIGSPLRPWLLKIAANRVRSHRRRRMLAFVPLSWADWSTPSPEPSPQSRSEQADIADELHRALAELPHDQRQVIVLRFYAELSVPEIAQATGWREGTVKSRLHRALGRMRPLLRPLTEE